MISAPGDQGAAVEVAQEAIKDLDDLVHVQGHSLKAFHWKSNISGGRSERAQDVINDQTDNCDAIIVIIGTRLGTETGDYLSGTVEELVRHTSRRRTLGPTYDVLVFFNNTAAVDPLSIDAEQLSRVQEFRDSLNSMGIDYRQYSDSVALRKMIQLGLTNLIARQKPQSGPDSIDSLEEFEEIGFDDAMEITNEKMRCAAQSVKNISTSMSVATAKLGSAGEMMSSGTADESSRTVLDLVATILKDQALELAPIIEDLKTNLSSAYAHMSVALTIAVEDLDMSGDNSEFFELEGAVGDASKSMSEFLATTISTRSTISKMPRRTTKLNQSKRYLLAVYDTMNSVVEGAISDFESLRGQFPKPLD